MESESNVLLNANHIPFTSQFSNFSNHLNLKSYGKGRLLKDMFSLIKPRCKLSPNFLILVMDEYGAKVISHFCEFFELMENGKCY